MRLLGLLVASLALDACSSTTDENVSFDNFVGVFAGDDGVTRGRLAFAIAEDSSTASGVYNLNGTNHSFTSVVAGNGQVVASDASVTFTGAVTPEDISGTLDGPILVGLFTAVRAPSGTVVTAYCGAHVGYNDLGQPAGGVFAFVNEGTTNRGVITTVNGRLRGYLANVNSVPSIDTVALAGYSLSWDANGFNGDYQAQLGDNAVLGGGLCPGTPPNPTLSEITGVFGTNSVTTSDAFGSLSLNLSSDGVGSSGHFTDSLGTHEFSQIISGPGDRVFMYAPGRPFTGIFTAGSLTGDTFDAASKSGLFAAVSRTPGDVVTAYCGTHVGNFDLGGEVHGSYAFLRLGATALSGVYTSDNIDLAAGFVGGDAGGQNATMGGLTGPVAVIPDALGFGGTYFFEDLGLTGSLSGTLCP